MNMLWKTCAALVAGVLMGRIGAAQTGSVAAGMQFDYGHANLVQGCNCFNLYGGAAQVQFGLSRHVSLLGDVTVARQSGLTPDGYALTESTYMGGLRYFPLPADRMAGERRRLLPFGDVLLGLAHAGGSLAPSRTGYGASNIFGLQLGGGVQLTLGKHVKLVPAQAEYLLTTFPNGGSNRQNQLRLSAGLLYRWRR